MNATPSSNPRTTASAADAARRAVQISFVLSGLLPRSGAALTIETVPTRLTREEFKRALEQVSDAARGALSFRIAEPTITMLGPEGAVIERSRLAELPERVGYAVIGADEELVPLVEWLVLIASRYGKKRALVASSGR